MTIAVFSDSFFPVLNGVSVSVRTLIVELRRMGHRVYVFAPRYPGRTDEDPDVVRLRSVRTPWARNYPLAYPPFGSARRRFRALSADLVHTHTPYVTGLCGLRWGAEAGIPVVSTYHTLYRHYAHYIALIPRSLVERKIARHTAYYYNRVARVLTPSGTSRRALLDHGVRTPIEVIPTGIPPVETLPKEDARAALGIPPDEFTMMYVGRVAPEKNLGLLLAAAERWRERIPNGRLRIVGDGPGRKLLQADAARLGVVLHGMVPRERVPVYLAAADLFVFPSVTETQGLVIGEAQAAGLPAVAVNEGGAPEAVTDGIDGFVVPNDPDAFAEKVITLAGDRETLSRMGAAAKEASRRWTPADMAERVARVYEQVLREEGKIAVRP